ncbi:SusC/RagA family TonB-linked outer membrane protein [Pedobacter insulae]|uniref:TonB-linked outer membrane protein, SusC/RagA family n=1 Tax=Pedobacter insulae TaxID=414048 RepID=A0A1I2WH88_9SPHI|nr:SusC/RagA family TonB-linked outer membrane protein [Pedobacter insulae]SFH00618.1 TonB-linked outer membrane protein, SusC/RagA family [Pedobacter insulae]
MRKNYQSNVSKLVLTLVMSFMMLIANAQNRNITGRVTDASGVGIPSAGVLIKGTKITTLTDGTGNFSIPAKNGDILVFSFIGLIAKEVVIGNQSSIAVTLEEDNQALNEVVVVGYGTIKKSKLTGSVSKLDPKVLETGMRSNPAQALAGTIPGLRVSTTTGRPGSVASITLRGGTNFDGSGSPLILMDGQVRNSLSDINSEEIESMEILKDASATAIYGARASNGVILITSKRGKTGSSSISLKSRTGVSYLNTPYDFLSAEDYIKWTRLGVVEAIKNGTLGTVASNSALAAVGPRGTGNVYKDGAGNILDGNYSSNAIWSTMRLTAVNQELLSKNTGWKTMKDAVPTNAQGNYDPNGTYADLIYKDFNYGDYGLHKTALSQDYNISMNGGNDKGSYFANIGYYNEGGLSLKTFYRRLNFSVNGDYNVKEWLKSESGVQFIKANWRDQSLFNGEANYWGRMLSAPPTMRGTNEKGDLLLGRDASDGNPIINIDKYKVDNQSDKFTLSQAFKVDFTKDLFFKVKGTLFYEEGFYESFNRDFRTGIMSLTNPNTGWNRDRTSAASFNRTTRQTYNAILNYKKLIHKNSFDAMVGAEYFDAYSKGFSADGKLAPTDDFQDLNLTAKDVAGIGARNIVSSHSRERILSQFARANYDYDEKYLLSFTVRRDGFSRLIGDNQFGIFPAGSAGWVISKENFMQSTQNWLSFLKLRASYGKNGNIGIGTSNAIGLYELQGAYGPQNAYNGVIGFLNTPANPNLRWEKSTTLEGGLDMAFLKNRITAGVGVYNRITSDKLANVQLPTSSGVSSVRTNNGSMQNTGVELEANYKIIQKSAVRWEIGANAAWNKNRILKLPFNGNENNRQGGQQIYDPATNRLVWVAGLQEGQEPGEIYGFVKEGIIRNADDLAKYNKIDLAAGQVWYGGSAGKKVASQSLIASKNLNPNANSPTFIATRLGDVKWKDIDLNDTIDTRDMVKLGRTLPRWTGGFNTSISWKGLSLFARIDFALGYKQMDFMQLWALGSFQGEFNATEVVKDTWTPENPNAAYPRYTWADQLNSKNFDRPSDMFWVNSNYLNFREVSLSYSLPTKLLQKAKIGGLTITATGQNLGYLTNKQLNLPERTGSQNSAYIIPTQVIFGANLTF